MNTILLAACFLFNLLAIFAQPLEIGTVTDIDDNVYQTVVIGNYEWMAENLKTSTLNDGIKIPNVTECNEWSSLSGYAYCWYNNSESYADTYGSLYNWFTVSSGCLCPSGWRVPTDDDMFRGSHDKRFGFSVRCLRDK